MTLKTNNASQLTAVTRRDLLKLGLGGAAVTAMTPVWGQSSNARGRVVIVGAGAGGLALANRLVGRMPMAEIVVVDSRPQHWYQPGLTMVASGVWRADEVVTRNDQWMPRGIEWVQARVNEFVPEQKQLGLDNGTRMDYDFLVVATGLQVNYSDIEGFSPDLIGQHGIGCVYDTPEHASRTHDAIGTWLAAGGGKGLFIGAPGPIKCAGAPIKMAFTTLSRLEQSDRRDQYEMHYTTPTDRFLGSIFTISL